MPYISQEARKDLYYNGATPENAGELNYLITQVIIDYLEEHGESYQRYNDVVGTLECCKLEIYRRLISEYEDEKIKENGDVF